MHLDAFGNPVAPLYNYTKSIEQEIRDDFFSKYGPRDAFLAATGSDDTGMLNSGMQLYWLKYKKPDIFEKIKYSLHLPQYISYVFTGIPVSEYTSLGCHTQMWNYSRKDYHEWIYEEEIYKILPPIISTETSINMNYNGKRIKVGAGIHDSSAALLPYVKGSKEKFILLSTGTWSIAFNPFANGHLREEDIKGNCINYMRINGKPVKASRVFLGHEYMLQVKKLTQHFKVDKDYHKKIKFDYPTYFEISKDFEHIFRWESFEDEDMPDQTVLRYTDFDHAYHHLMIELTLLQVKNIKRVTEERGIKNLYIDGGFAENDIHVNLLSHYLRNMQVMTTDSALGSSIGAAIAISDNKLNSKFLRKNYALKKHVPFIVK